MRQGAQEDLSEGCRSDGYGWREVEVSSWVLSADRVQRRRNVVVFLRQGPINQWRLAETGDRALDGASALTFRSDGMATGGREGACSGQSSSPVQTAAGRWGAVV